MSNNQLLFQFACFILKQLIHIQKARHANLPRHPQTNPPV